MLVEQKQTYLSVTDLTTMLKVAVENEFPRVQFQGEISGLKKATSGHIYLTLKDSVSQIPAVIWRGGARIDFNLEDGIEVVCTGKATVYPQQGRLQMVLTSIAPVGEGLLQKKLLELKKKLEAEGLLAQERKRDIPFLPKAVGVVTSPTGAVIRDIMVKIRERLPHIAVYLAPVRVQGESAAAEIAAGIRLLNKSKLVDVIIVGRGGGSKEDLWAFNEELVVRAVAASAIPVVSAVGHETDISLSDLVADRRAPTPTAAAEMVVPKAKDLLARVQELWERVSDYERRLEPIRQRIDELDERLGLGIMGVIENNYLRLEVLEGKIKGIDPAHILRMFGLRVANAEKRILNTGLARIEMIGRRISEVERRLMRGSKEEMARRELVLKGLAQRLEGVNPRNVLQRGYAMLEKGGSVVTELSGLRAEDEVSILMSTGRAEAKIQKVSLSKG
jgi:exodeoxyribonuclease VII large subunit